MAFDKRLIAGKLRRWEKYLNNYRLPRWEEIPDLGLYMDQVLTWLGKYLDYLPPELKEEQFITATTINNYVRTKMMPEPQKKRYYRVHLAYLIVICTLKQSLSLATLRKLLPLDVPQEEVRSRYEVYAYRHEQAAQYFIEQVRLAAGPILDHENAPEMAIGNTEELIASSAVVSGFFRLLAEKLLLLEGRTLEDGDDISLR